MLGKLVDGPFGKDQEILLVSWVQYTEAMRKEVHLNSLVLKMIQMKACGTTETNILRIVTDN